MDWVFISTEWEKNRECLYTVYLLHVYVQICIEVGLWKSLDVRCEVMRGLRKRGDEMVCLFPSSFSLQDELGKKNLTRVDQ